MLTSDSTDEQSEDSFIFLEMDLVNVIQISTSRFYSLRNSLMAMSHLVKENNYFHGIYTIKHDKVWSNYSQVIMFWEIMYIFGIAL